MNPAKRDETLVKAIARAYAWFDYIRTAALVISPKSHHAKGYRDPTFRRTYRSRSLPQGLFSHSSMGSSRPVCR